MEAWAALGEMSTTEARREFLSVLHAEVPSFAPWFLEKSTERAEAKRRAQEAEERARLERERLEKERLERERQRELAAQMAAAQAAKETNEASAHPNNSSATNETEEKTNTTFNQSIDQPTPEEFRAEMAKAQNSSLSIGRGDITRVRISNSKPGDAHLEWTFCSEMYDVSFGVEFEPSNGSEDTSNGDNDGDSSGFETLLAAQRCASHERVYTGRAFKPEPGFYHLVFDNSYSWMTSKHVRHRIKVTCLLKEAAE